MSVTTTANFTIPAIGSSTGSVAVTDTSQTPQNSVITVYNASAGKVALMQVGVVTDGTHFASLETLDIFAGAAGDTMPSGSVITFPSAPLSSLPSLSSPSGSDLLYVVHSGTSYQSTVTEVVTAGGGGGGGGISYPTLASAFTPATPGNTATATLSAAPTGALFPGMKIQLPITGSDEPFEGIVESISGTSVVIRTPIPTSTNPVGGFQVAPPVECPALSSFTWYNQGTAVSANGFGFNRVMNITYAGSVEYRLLGLPQANTPFTLTALIYANFPDINSSLAGIYVMDTVSTNLSGIELLFQNTDELQIRAIYTASPAGSPNVFGTTFQFQVGLPVWLRLQYDGTHFIYSFSFDGGYWRVLYTTTSLYPASTASLALCWGGLNIGNSVNSNDVYLGSWEVTEP